MLRILEGHIVIDTSGSSALPSYYRARASLAADLELQLGKSSYNGNQSGCLSGEWNQRSIAGTRSMSPPLSSYSGSLLTNASAKRKVNAHIDTHPRLD